MMVRRSGMGALMGAVVVGLLMMAPDEAVHAVKTKNVCSKSKCNWFYFVNGEPGRSSLDDKIETIDVDGDLAIENIQLGDGVAFKVNTGTSFEFDVSASRNDGNGQTVEIDLTETDEELDYPVRFVMGYDYDGGSDDIVIRGFDDSPGVISVSGMVHMFNSYYDKERTVWVQETYEGNLGDCLRVDYFRDGQPIEQTSSGDKGTSTFTYWSDNGCNRTELVEFDIKWKPGSFDIVALTGDDDDFPFQAAISGDNAPDTSSSSSKCFAGSSLVDVLLDDEYVVRRRIDALEIGDLVRTATPTSGADAADPFTFSFSPVVYLPHQYEPGEDADGDASAEDEQEEDGPHRFYEVVTESGRKLRVTHDHLLATVPCDGRAPARLLPMDDMRRQKRTECLVIADSSATTDSMDAQLVLEPIRAVNLKHDEAVYSVVTTNPSGYVVVNDVVASSFGFHHDLPNTFYHTHRAIFRLFPSFLETNLMHWMTMRVGGGMADSLLQLKSMLFP